MPRTDEVTAYYIRTSDGDAFYVDTLAEALEEFLGEKGYRLTFASSKKELVLRRTSNWQTWIVNGIAEEHEKEAEARMVFRDKENK